MATNVTGGLVVLTTGKSMSTESKATWESLACPHCQGQQLVRVAVTVDDHSQVRAWSTRWLRCVACHMGSIVINGTIHPTAKPLREPAGLPPIDKQIWEEARLCLGVGANAAAVMLCRKLLLHLAVAHGLDPKNDKGRAPTFVEAVDHLESEGVVTKKMRPWVDRIKDVGNEANHELQPVSPEVALDVATFTEQLLRLAYEMDALMAGPGGDNPGASSTAI